MLDQVVAEVVHDQLILGRQQEDFGYANSILFRDQNPTNNGHFGFFNNSLKGFEGQQQHSFSRAGLQRCGYCSLIESIFSRQGLLYSK